MNPEIDPSQMTSLEAAALYLSGGKTRDPALAVVLDENAKDEFNMDAMQRAHLRRMMGFDFRMKMAPNKIHVSSKEEPYVTTHCKIREGEMNGQHIVKESLIDRLVDACLRLKIKHDAEVARLR